MPSRGFKINSCDCGEILIDYGEIKDDISGIKLPMLNDEKNIREHYKYCQKCREFIKVSN
jgi:hypothetical protein